MSLRTLVKQAKAAARIEHVNASYTSRGQLMCNVCDVPVKHETLFAAHLSSKQHRTNIQLKAQLQAKRAREEEQQRAAVVEYPDSEPEEEEEDEEPDRKRAKLDDNPLPADFFSDPAQAPSFEPREETPEAVDEEWAAFEKEVLGAAVNKTAAAATISAPAEVYDTRATVHAEPVLYGDEKTAQEAAIDQEMEDLGGVPPETEEEKQARLDLEEREELLSRIEEEEREQLEADERVEVMKRRLEAVREAKSTGAKVEGVKADKGLRWKKKAKAKA